MFGAAAILGLARGRETAGLRHFSSVGHLSLFKKQQCQKCLFLFLRTLLKHFYRFPCIGNRKLCFFARKQARRIIISEASQFIKVEGNSCEVCNRSNPPVGTKAVSGLLL